jgi:hypothetical protein
MKALKIWVKCLKLCKLRDFFCSSQRRTVVFQVPSLECSKTDECGCMDDQCDAYLNLLKHHLVGTKPSLAISPGTRIRCPKMIRFWMWQLIIIRFWLLKIRKAFWGGIRLTGISRFIPAFVADVPEPVGWRTSKRDGILTTHASGTSLRRRVFTRLRSDEHVSSSYVKFGTDHFI